MKVGKPMMKRFSAPPVKKVVEKKKEYKPEEQDMIDYDLGDILPMFMALKARE